MDRPALYKKLSTLLESEIEPAGLGAKSLQFSVQPERIVVQVGMHNLPANNAEERIRSLFRNIYERITKIVHEDCDFQQAGFSVLESSKLQLYLSDEYGMGRMLMGVVTSSSIEWEPWAANIVLKSGAGKNSRAV